MLIAVFYDSLLKDILVESGFCDSQGKHEIYPKGFVSYSIYHDKWL